VEDSHPKPHAQGCCCHAAHLTRREVEVLTLVALGMVTSEIAGRLHVSKRTVEAHLAAMLRRSGAHTRAELVALGFASGIFTRAAWPPRPSGTFCLSPGVEAIAAAPA
jgi:DNA-binding NarL/FixJ family response regulator